MVNKKKALLAIAITIFAITSSFSTVHARGTATGTVDSLTSSAAITNVFLSERIVAVSGETRPACATRDQNFALGPDQRNQLAILLTALALESEVRITGSGTCDLRNGTEDVGSIRVLGQ